MLPWNGVEKVVWLTDKFHGLRVGVLPAAGGEMSSFQLLSRKGSWWEVLHRALDYTEWPSESDQRAPLLWPAVGRSFTREQLSAWQKTRAVPVENRFEFAGATYVVGVHGFARKLPWTLDDSGSDRDAAWAKVSLQSSEQTAAAYPFEFKVSVTYSLAGGVLVIEYEVIAGDNRSPMPFSIGNHLCLRMPFSQQGRFDECTLRTPARCILHQNELCLLDGRRTKVDLSQPTSIAREELLDSVLGNFAEEEAWVELRDTSSSVVRISHRDKQVDGLRRCGADDLLFVFWGDAQQQYFCPEPWIGKPNSLNTGDGCVRLEPGERFGWEITIEAQRG